MGSHAVRDAAGRDLRAAVIATAQAMSRSGLSPGRSGNVSARSATGMLITPSGIVYETLTPDEVVEVSLDGIAAVGALKPSSEWRFHAAVFRARPDIDAIVHTHSVHAVVLACARRPIPAFHYMVAAAGGADIPCVPYATFGTEELASHVAAGLAARNACLMANHGQIAIGTTLERALDLAREVEILAEQYMKVLMLGEVHLLDAAEMARVIERFKSYGQNAQSGPRTSPSKRR
jgi:L-fuculose-phosphate aldolase